MEMPLPAEFKQTILDLYDERGQEWLAHLPELIAELEARWSFRAQAHFSALSYNYVAPVVCLDGTEAVLKLGVPNRELSTEVGALRLYAGQGMVELYEADVEIGALLMERVQPGRALADLEDDERTTTVLATTMQQLWRPLDADHPFPHAADWGEALKRLRPTFDGGTGPFPAHLVDLALETYAGMRASSTAPLLLHGDLHHYNILSARRQPWLAIDPKGLAGEAAYECGQLLLNPFHLSEEHHRRLIPRRIEQLASELGLDRQRLIQVTLAHVMLSGWWSYEDHGHGYERAVMAAQTLHALL